MKTRLQLLYKVYRTPIQMILTALIAFLTIHHFSYTAISTIGLSIAFFTLSIPLLFVPLLSGKWIFTWKTVILWQLCLVFGYGDIFFSPYVPILQKLELFIIGNLSILYWRISNTLDWLDNYIALHRKKPQWQVVKPKEPRTLDAVLEAMSPQDRALLLKALKENTELTHKLALLAMDDHILSAHEVMEVLNTSSKPVYNP